MILSGFLAGAVFFGERPSLWIWASVGLFSTSLALIIKGKRHAVAA
jgi:drug/metabolite transporter (DMT)-like permease